MATTLYDIVCICNNEGGKRVGLHGKSCTYFQNKIFILQDDKIYITNTHRFINITNTQGTKHFYPRV